MHLLVGVRKQKHKDGAAQQLQKLKNHWYTLQK